MDENRIEMWPPLSGLVTNILKEKHHPVLVFVDVCPNFVGGVDLFPVALPSQQLGSLSPVGWTVEYDVVSGLRGDAVAYRV